MSQEQKIFMWSLLTVAILGGGIGTFFAYSHTNANFTGDTTSKISSNTQDKLSLDTDGDGLPDWKEELIGTNKNLADTDGDGTSDGEEVSAGRDPLIAGPNDYILNTMSTSTEATTASAQDSIAQDILTVVTNNNSLGQSLTSDQVSYLSDRILSQVKLKELSFKTYSRADLNVISSNSLETWQLFANAVDSALGNVRNQESEIKLLGSFLNDKNTEALTSLQSIASVYTKAQGQLVSLPIPNEALDTYVAFLNSFSKITASINVFANAKNEPDTVISVLKTYNQDTADLAKIYYDFHVVVYQHLNP